MLQNGVDLYSKMSGQGSFGNEEERLINGYVFEHVVLAQRRLATHHDTSCACDKISIPA